MGCFCLTELGHGSDVSKLETTAHFDEVTNEFIIHSPTETSRKFWIGNLAITATKAVVFAQLIMNGVNYGLHGFLISIRNKKTHEPLFGLEIGDCGDKLGLQAIDNGWIKFYQYRVPKTALLNQFVDISADGVYESQITSKSKLMAIQLGSLSGGRITISQSCVDASLVSASIPIRYWATRKQFKNPKTKIETRLLDYRINHYRVLTHLSRALVNNIGVTKITEYWNDYLPHSSDLKNENTGFIHLISSCAKAVFSWNTNDTANEARQACGGLGYSLYNGLAEPIMVSDLNRTWEGDNNILLQQAGKLILKNLSDLYMDKPVMKTFEFLTIEAPDPSPYEDSLNDIHNLLHLITVKTVTLIHETGTKLQFADDKIDEWDKLLAFNVYPMVHGYFQRFLLSMYIEFCERFNEDAATKEVFTMVGVIYAQQCILDDLDYFRDYLSREKVNELKESLMDNLLILRKDAVALTYTVPFTDKMYGEISRNEMKPYQYFLDAVDRAGKDKLDNTDHDIIVTQK
jgi:acyl-CoA oxidase